MKPWMKKLIHFFFSHCLHPVVGRRSMLCVAIVLGDGMMELTKDAIRTSTTIQLPCL